MTSKNDFQNLLHIPVDVFLYSCHQAYISRKKNKKPFDSHLRYEPLLYQTLTLPSKPSYQSFLQELESIIIHHQKAICHYREEQPIHQDNVSWFSLSIATLFADMEDLITLYTGEGLSLYIRTNSKATPALSSWIPTYTEGIFKGEETPSPQSPASLGQEIWGTIIPLITKHFPAHQSFILSYAQWKYQNHEKTKITKDWRITPPCGLAWEFYLESLQPKESRFHKKDAKPFNPQEKNEDISRKTSFEKKRNENFSQESSYKPKNKGEPSSESPSESSYKPKNKGEPSSESSPRPFSQPSSKPFSKFSKDKDSKPKATEDSLRKAQEEAQKGVDIMNQNSDMESYPLSPQNSFLRREQHMVIERGGYDTQSEGVGTSRHVRIIRKS